MMKKIVTVVTLGMMLASMAIPSFAATPKEAADSRSGFTITADCSYDGRVAQGWGRTNKQANSIYVTMKVETSSGGSYAVPASAYNKTIATAKKSVANVDYISVKAEANKSGEKVNDFYSENF